MSYEASAHEAQMKILRNLLLSPSAGFAQLQKQTALTSDHANFHIKKLVEVGYVNKDDDGRYVLSRRGKEYANRMDTEDNEIEKQPKLSIVLVVENEHGEVLVQQRLKQPYYGFWGVPTGKVRWGEKLLDAAARELREETGITARLRMSGFYHKLDYDETTRELLEDKMFCVVHGTEPKGELISDDEGHHNEWSSEVDFVRHERRFASMIEVMRLARNIDVDFLEESHFYNQEEY